MTSVTNPFGGLPDSARFAVPDGMRPMDGLVQGTVRFEDVPAGETFRFVSPDSPIYRKFSRRRYHAVLHPNHPGPLQRIHSRHLHLPVWLMGAVCNDCGDVGGIADVRCGRDRSDEFGYDDCSGVVICRGWKE